MNNEDLKVATQVAWDTLGCNADLKRVSGQGTCNSVFFAKAGQKKIVVRVNMDRDPKEFTKESWCMSQAEAADVSVPRSLSHGFQNGWNFSVQSFEGKNNGTDSGDPISIWHWLGEAAAKFHKVPVKGFGWNWQTKRLVCSWAIGKLM